MRKFDWLPIKNCFLSRDTQIKQCDRLTNNSWVYHVAIAPYYVGYHFNFT